MALPSTDDLIGRLLDGRYRLIAPLGSGASATVYLGDDVTLRRPVAVKVLHPALADDTAFIRRFRAEAQAAAALNHPNVLAVHDWGQDGLTPFLVSEFLAGGSLRSMLDTSGPLTSSQTLVVGLEAARGLAYAHRRSLVHRDIKPANLLFDDEARLRIADFGLARALAEASWTEPMGAVLGTARYASPEQARGETLESSSDVYSLALVLVEAATGELPFGSDTTLGTLMARVDANLPVPDGLGPLGEVLTAAGALNPADRPDADTLSSALFDAARQMDRPGPLLLAGLPWAAGSAGPDTEVGAGATHATPEDADPTVIDHEPEAAVVTDDTVDATSGENGPGHLAAAVAATAATGTFGGSSVVTAPADPFPDKSDSPAEDSVDGPTDGPSTASGRSGRSRRWPLVVALLVASAIVGGSVFWWTSVRVASAEVPVLVGVAVTAAEQAALDAGWELRRSEAFDPVVAAGLVLSQDPEAGVMLSEGGILTVVVSAGPAPVPLPDGLVGAPLTDVEQRLVEVGLAVGTVTETFDEEVPAGVVMSASVEPGVEVPFGGEVDFVVSAGPEPRTIPDDLVGRALDEVRSLLEALGLPVNVAGEAYSDTVAAGSVVGAVPRSGEVVPRGTLVNVEVSLGPPVVRVPNVIGLSVVEAARQLEAIGLIVTSLAGSPSQPVTGTSPASGSTVRIGSDVAITTR